MLYIICLNKKKRIYAHDLQSKSLKEIQPQICDAMDSLSLEMAAQDDIRVNLSRSSYNQRNRGSYDKRKQDYKPSKMSTQKQKQCILCKASGRSFQGHDISSC